MNEVPKNKVFRRDREKLVGRECTELENLQCHVAELKRYLQIACNLMNSHKVFNKEVDTDLFIKYCDSYTKDDFDKHGLIENDRHT